MNRLCKSFIAGMLATVPMTIWMLAANKFFPTPKKDPLPPEEITENLVEQVTNNPKLSKEQKKGLAVLNHFFYGGVVGIPYSLFNGKTFAQGTAYGLLVWASNYLGLLPTLNLYPSAKQEPQRMNGIMVLGHIIWGSSLNYLNQNSFTNIKYT